MQKFSYHTHTPFSDGTNTIEEMLEYAVKLGWEEIGISDHLVIHKNIRNAEYFGYERNNVFVFEDFESALKASNAHVEKIKEAARKYPLKVHTGFEVDYFPYQGWEESFKQLKSKSKADYFINGNHLFFDEKCEKLIGINDPHAQRFNDTAKAEHISRHFQTIKKAIESGLYDFIAHVDYVRGTGFMEERDFEKEIMDIIKALVQNKIPTEINTKSYQKLGYFMPIRWILEELRDHNIPIVISDDAHNINELSNHFEKAEQHLTKLNYINRFQMKL